MTFSQLFSTDPMIIIESFTLVLAFAYLARMLFVPGQPEDVNRRPYIARSYKSARKQVSLFSLPRLLSLFEVGSLISLPKQSLRRQHISRQFA